MISKDDARHGAAQAARDLIASGASPKIVLKLMEMSALIGADGAIDIINKRAEKKRKQDA